jgi:hypothetical protein
MLQRIENAEAYLRFQNEFRRHNEACEWYTFERTVKSTGRVVEIQRQRGTITEAVKTTFYIILGQYVASYNRTAATMPAGMYTIQDPPSLLTNCVRLAKPCDCSDRTVRNHLRKLKELGVIATKFHGSNADFELWINPEILFGTEALAAAENSENTAQIAFKGLNPKNFPHTDTQIQIFEKEKGVKDMLVLHGENDQGQRGRTDQGATAPSPPLGEAGREAQREMKPGGRRAAIAAHNAQLRQEKAQAMLGRLQAPVPRGLDARYIEMLLEFWLYAWKVLYQKREFSKEAQGEAIAAISAGVYNDFQDERTPRQWADFQVYQLTKLDKAAKYYDNHPEAYLPDPYALYVKGKGYFDAENLRGFIGIDAWMKKDSLKSEKTRLDYQQDKANKIRRNEALLRTARRDFEKLRAGLPPRKEMIGKTQIGLFQHYKTVFDGQGKAWLQRFCDQYAEQVKRDFQPPLYMKVRRKREMAGETVVMVEDWMTEGDGYYSE